MTPVIVAHDEAIVLGIDITTSNAAEADPACARIPMLWSRFYSEGVLSRIPGKKAPEVAMGVYTDYESDHNGRYRLLAGAAVEAGTPAMKGFARATLPAGRYLKFSGEGEMPGVVIDTWKTIWSHFSRPGTDERAYTADFEVYRGPKAVDIYIALK